MIRKTVIISCLFSAFATLCGCATVDPRHDYDRVGKRIAEATGQERVYQPEDDALVAEMVDVLSQDGTTAAEAVEICLLNNPTLHAAFMGVGMARADVVQAGLFTNPFIGISARFPDGGGLANIEASVAQNIAELWQIPVRKRAAERSLDRAILDLARTAAGLAAEAKVAYYVAVGADERHRIAQENLVIAQDLLELSLARQEAGAANELDVNLSRSLALNADVEVERSRLASADARRALATLLGLVSQADGLVLVDPLPGAYPKIADAPSLVELAKGWRLDLRAAREAVALAQAQLEEQYRLIFPVVELGLELEREERRSAGGQDTIFGPSLGVELPIFDQNQAQIAKAQYALRQARKTLDAFDRAVTQEVRSAVDRALTAWRLMQKFREQSIPLAQRNLELSREAYRAGRASFLSVLEAQRFSLEARSGLVSAAQTAATAVPELERTIGLPFAKLLAQLNAEPAQGTKAGEKVEP
ncbi:MAG: TolC family protein [Phycisphaerae bacterium]